MDFYEPENYRLAMELVEKTGKNVFLTGKAGTGKTTFLQLLRNRTFKRHVVVAPTGVAAINARGVTIHSFFHLPLRPLLIDELNEKTQKEKKLFKYSAEKLNIIRTLDLLIIDEVSMVRADILDAIDFILRFVRNDRRPFGNVQLLMVGDLYQLSPVVKSDEWQLLSQYYNSPYFFESKALNQSDYVTVELDKIFRQESEEFIRILNKIREGHFDSEVNNCLQSRYVPDFDDNRYPNYIVLTTHNAKANQINQSKLNDLPAKAMVYKAIIRGDFPPEIYPTEASLLLKVGAQVMFLRNDTSDRKLYYNGKVGKIVELGDNYIKVKTPEDDNIISVEPATWENIQYTLDPESQTIQEEVLGVFTQYPLKLAWAITIHKSQGLTFDKVAIDAQNAFAHGQVYVALSRCRNLDGVVLLNKINFKAVKADPRLIEYHSQIHTPDREYVSAAQKEYLFHQVEDLFNFNRFSSLWQQFINVLRYNDDEIRPAGVYRIVADIRSNFNSRVIEVAEKFLVEIALFKQQNADYISDAMQERIKKAVAYFTEQLSHFTGQLMNIKIETEEKLIKKKVVSAYNQLSIELSRKKMCLLAVREGFQLEKYLEAKAKADLAPLAKDKIQQPAPNVSKRIQVKQNSLPKLYARIREWRRTKADEAGMPEEKILPYEQLSRLIIMPQKSLTALKQIVNFPDEYAQKWEEELMQILLKHKD